MQLWSHNKNRSNIVGTALSFSFNLSENPLSNWALFVYESMVKSSEQNTEFLLTLPGSSLKKKVLPLFPNVGIRKNAMQRLFFHNLALHRIFLSSEHLYLLIFVYICVCLFCYLHYMDKSVWGQAGSDVEAGVDLPLRGQCLATLLHHKVVHSTTCCFGKLASI